MDDISKFDQLSISQPQLDRTPLAGESSQNTIHLPGCRLQILEIAPICQLLSCSRVTLWRIRQSDPTFPLPISLGDKKSIRFVEYEIHEWLRQKMHARTAASLSSEGI